MNLQPRSKTHEPRDLNYKTKEARIENLNMPFLKKKRNINLEPLLKKKKHTHNPSLETPVPNYYY